MLALRRSIPRVASASLVLGGATSCGGGGGGGPATIADTTLAFCRSFEACAPNFDVYFTSIEDCAAQSEDDDRVLGGYVLTYYAEACAQAVLDYYECYWTEYLDLCAAVPSSRCATERSALNAACTP